MQPPPPRSSAMLGMGSDRHFSFEPLAGERVGWGGIMRDDLIVIEGIINE